jgi:hypothetical protein
MKFEEAFSLMREGKKIQYSNWKNSRRYCFIKNKEVYISTYDIMNNHITPLFYFQSVHLFGEWEVYDETKS